MNTETKRQNARKFHVKLGRKNEIHAPLSVSHRNFQMKNIVLINSVKGCMRSVNIIPNANKTMNKERKR